MRKEKGKGGMLVRVEHPSVAEFGWMVGGGNRDAKGGVGDDE